MYLSIECCFCVKPRGESFFRCCKHPARPEDGLGGCWNVKGQVHQEMKEVKFTTTTDYQGPVRYVEIGGWDATSAGGIGHEPD